ncbi:hypothetical protein [Macrococcus armenti]|uniref:hypothetical protein n=1 Tax=Macrococcus armenti TaxID=2875764 RepID=UPI001CCA28BB|nr:hypothetical protein [Macrococcus armenti]UBH14876.1 hypothetical protein LAU44_08910 [Macrococcus armenti]UBH17236.1 hypothetical protein LAU39_08940 [Macrococcus armenti]UBH19501.1 hypothetical protein LAU40_08920 [Macrococcus armenti]
MNKAIRKVSSDKKTIEIGVNNIAAIEFRQNEKGGTLGAFDIYNAYDELGNILTIEGFFLDDNIQVEYKNDRPERQATLFDFM